MRYIPKLRRNLIFLGILDALRYSIKIDNNLIKVIKGYLIAMKVVKVSGLYVLHGITLDGKGTTSVVQSLDSAMLWPRRLGYISEKDLSSLDKLGSFCNKHLGNLEFFEHCVFRKQTR